MSKVTIPKDKNHLISFIFIALFSCVSFYTTFDGLKTYAQAKSFQEYYLAPKLPAWECLCTKLCLAKPLNYLSYETKLL